MPEFRNDKFSGGLTDGTLNPDPSQASELVNFLPDEFGKLVRRSGIEFYNSANPQIDGSPITKIFSRRVLAESDATLFFVTDKKLYVSENGLNTFTEIYGVNGDSLAHEPGVALASSKYNTAGITVSKIRDLFFITGPDLPSVIVFKGRSRGTVNLWRIVAATLPKPVRSSGSDLFPLEINYDNGGDATRTYAVVNVFEFTTDTGVEYRMQSTPNYSYTKSDGSTLGGQTGESFSGLQLLGQAGDFPHYPVTGDYDGVRETFRTVANGSVFKRMGHVSRLSSSYAQDDGIFGAGVADDPYYNGTGGLQEEMYTEAGVTGNSGLGYSSLPADRHTTDVKLAAITSNGVAWGINVSGTMLRQSKPAQPYSWPAEFETGLTDMDATAVASAGPYAMVFSENSTKRVEGFLNASGLGTTLVRSVSDDIGCVSQDSIAIAGKKVYFAGKDGFYKTDGFNVTPVSPNSLISRRFVREWGGSFDAESLEETIFSTAVDHTNHRIFWLINNSKGARLIVHPIQGGGLFELKTKFTPISLHYSESTLILGDDAGYIHKLYASTEMGDRLDGTDIRTYDLDTTDTDSLQPIESRLTYIDYKYRTVPLSFGSETAAKWMTKLLLVFSKLQTNLTIYIKAINDRVKVRDMVSAFEKNPTSEGGIHVIKRRFPSGTLRATTKQIEIGPARSILITSDDYGVADYYPIGTLSGNTEPVVIVAGGIPDISTPSTSVLLQYIRFEFDGYVLEHKIILASGDTMKLLTGPAGGVLNAVKWEIVGYPRDEQVRLESTTIDYAVMGDSHEAFQVTDPGGNV